MNPLIDRNEWPKPRAKHQKQVRCFWLICAHDIKIYFGGHALNYSAKAEQKKGVPYVVVVSARYHQIRIRRNGG